MNAPVKPRSTVLRVLKAGVNRVRHAYPVLRPFWWSLVLDLISLAAMLAALAIGIFMIVEKSDALGGFVFVTLFTCAISLFVIITTTRNLITHFKRILRLLKLPVGQQQSANNP